MAYGKVTNITVVTGMTGHCDLCNKDFDQPLACTWTVDSLKGTSEMRICVSCWEKFEKSFGAENGNK